MPRPDHGVNRLEFTSDQVAVIAIEYNAKHDDDTKTRCHVLFVVLLSLSCRRWRFSKQISR